VLAGLVFVMGVAYVLGKRESARLGISKESIQVFERQLTKKKKNCADRKIFGSISSYILIVTALIWGKVAPAVLFMIGATLALLVNYPNVEQQRARVDAHAKAALMMASILLAAGVFTGIMTGAGLTKAMTQVAVSFIPSNFAYHIPAIVAVLSMPLSLF